MSKSSSPLSYLLIGIGIGGALGLLLAPHSGEETQEWITDRVNERVGDLKKQGGRLRDKAAAWKSRGKDAAEEMARTASDKFDDVKDRLDDVKEDLAG